MHSWLFADFTWFFFPPTHFPVCRRYLPRLRWQITQVGLVVKVQAPRFKRLKSVTLWGPAPRWENPERWPGVGPLFLIPLPKSPSSQLVIARRVLEEGLSATLPLSIPPAPPNVHGLQFGEVTGLLASPPQGPDSSQHRPPDGTRENRALNKTAETGGAIEGRNTPQHPEEHGGIPLPFFQTSEGIVTSPDVTLPEIPGY